MNSSHSICAAVLLGFVVSGTAFGADNANTGITGMSPTQIVRHRAPDAPSDKIWLYQVAMPFQVSSTKAALFCNVREGLAQGVDFEVGNDVIVFGEVSEIPTAKPVVLSRNHTERNPNSDPPGQPATMVKYPVRGGFVPLGAKRPDGTPHPHAGTGFGLSIAQAWKVLPPGPPPYQQNSYRGKESLSYWELHHLVFDGEIMRVTSTDRLPVDQLLPGWFVPNGGMNNAISDGDDLLVAMNGRRIRPDDSTAEILVGCGYLRMRRTDGKWRAADFTLVPGTKDLFEPTLIRDRDGHLLFTGRGGRNPDRQHDVRVWLSTDAGRTWQLVIESNGIIVPPISLNQAVDGTPYIVANLQNIVPGPNDPLSKVPGTIGRNTRSTLAVWPLNATRTALENPIVVRDCRADFGPAAGGASWTWRADHPSGMTVRLAEGKWHHLLGVRVQDIREITAALPPTPHTGMHVHELLSKGTPHPPWKC